MTTAIDALVDDFLAAHFRYHPVDATFMGIAGHDHRLPPADAEAPAREAQELAALLARVETTPAPARGGAALDHRIARATLKHAQRELAERPRYRDPTWYTGEAAFGVISLLLPGAVGPTPEALTARLAAIPEFLAAGTARMRGAAACADWVARARKEIKAIDRLLTRNIRLHALWRPAMEAPAAAAAAAFAAFDAVVAALPDADPACGSDYLDFIMREIHGLPFGWEEAEARAAERFAELGEELDAEAAALNPARGWKEQIATLHADKPAPERLADTYRAWHDRALELGASLVTPASDYRLDFLPHPEWARDIAGDLYFLAYRSPPAVGAGAGSVYWVTGANQSVANIKQTHAVHHASVGHHTHNARARGATSRLARLAEAGCPRGVAFLTAGTTGEGWACYAQELMAEAPGFYGEVEKRLLLRQIEQRNVGCLLADIRLHTGRWSLAEMREFYAGEGGFPQARIWNETTRNSIFPGTRVMYWLGVEQIKAARRRWPGDARSFHDALLARGHASLSWVIDDMAPGAG